MSFRRLSIIRRAPAVFSFQGVILILIIVLHRWTFTIYQLPITDQWEEARSENREQRTENSTVISEQYCDQTAVTAYCIQDTGSALDTKKCLMWINYYEVKGTLRYGLLVCPLYARGLLRYSLSSVHHQDHWPSKYSTEEDNMSCQFSLLWTKRMAFSLSISLSF